MTKTLISLLLATAVAIPSAAHAKGGRGGEHKEAKAERSHSGGGDNRAAERQQRQDERQAIRYSRREARSEQRRGRELSYERRAERTPRFERQWRGQDDWARRIEKRAEQQQRRAVKAVRKDHVRSARAEQRRWVRDDRRVAKAERKLVKNAQKQQRALYRAAEKRERRSERRAWQVASAQPRYAYDRPVYAVPQTVYRTYAPPEAYALAYDQHSYPAYYQPAYYAPAYYDGASYAPYGGYGSGLLGDGGTSGLLLGLLPLLLESGIGDALGLGGLGLGGGLLGGLGGETLGGFGYADPLGGYAQPASAFDSYYSPDSAYGYGDPGLMAGGLLGGGTGGLAEIGALALGSGLLGDGLGGLGGDPLGFATADPYSTESQGLGVESLLAGLL